MTETGAVLALLQARRSPPPPVLASAGRSAVVLDSPHSGTHYPADFGTACDQSALRSAEDTHVERLFDFHCAVGAAWVEATFPRSYLDVNRGLGDIDATLLATPWPDDAPYGRAVQPDAHPKLRLGKGLVWKLTDAGDPIYRRLLPPEEVRARIERCWLPYHAALSWAIERALDQHGHCIHLNCHSMPSVAGSHATEFPGEVHPDFVLGDRDGSTAAPALTQHIRAFLQARGFTVAVNHPYKGVEIVRRHGDPGRGVHSVQLEINRALYMDESRFSLEPAAASLQATLRALVESLPQALA